MNTLQLNNRIARDRLWGKYAQQIDLVKQAIRQDQRELAELYLVQADLLYLDFRKVNGRKAKILTLLPWQEDPNDVAEQLESYS